MAQRIAAGEVIDRPQAIVRELIDNALDAQASHIEIEIEQGGISSIRILDDGTGMTREDLAICCESHATSKILSVEDLYHISTLGFRGEALASVAACSRLKIMSSFMHQQTYTLEIDEGRISEPVIGGYAKGTTIEVRDLFYSIPGRRNFLKSPQAEAAACKRTVIEKALAFPKISFKFSSNGRLVLYLPAAEPVKRTLDAYPKKMDPSFVRHVTERCGSFSLSLICTSASIYRGDRKFIQIFVNDRRIDEYALVQAVQYGYADHLPGGCFPYCFVHITIDPELVDFNIHPAKREVKLRNGREIHHQLVQTIKKFLLEEHRAAISEAKAPVEQRSFSFSRKQEPSSASNVRIPPPSYTPQYRKDLRRDDQWIERARRSFSPDLEQQDRPVVEDQQETFDFTYFGQLFGVFLIVEKDDELYLIDQHAAHEKILYREMAAEQEVQKLLIPIELEIAEQDEFTLQKHLKEYDQAGIQIERINGRWQLCGIPRFAAGIEQEIVQSLEEGQIAPEEITRKLYATATCRKAVKEGDVLDGLTARRLIKEAFSLEIPRCPHGRPIWKIITRDQLYHDVERLL